MAYGAEKARQIVDALLREARPCDLPAAASVGAPAAPAPSTDEPGVEVEEAPATVPAPSISFPSLTDDAASPAPAPLALDGGPSVREESAPAGESAAEESPAPVASPVVSPSAPSREALLCDTLTVRYEERRWDLAWLESPSPAQVRARVHLELGASGDGPDASPVLTFLDTLNLVASRAREAFCKRALALLPPGSPLSRDGLLLSMQADLLRLAALGEARKKLAEEKAPLPGALSPERRARGLSYLGGAHLLARITADLGTAGYVGEPTIKVLGYLVSISRKLPEALSMVILSSSGSGKSALAEVLETLTPEEDLLVVTRFTASSLYWMGKDALKRKFVSIEERGGSQEADYSIRALQSKKKVTMMAPIKDQATGRIETRLFEVEGPASFLESTTESQIHHENATRCFEVRLDESREQTLRIQDAQRRAKTREGQRERLLAGEVAALQKDVQRLLRPVRVVIPYAGAIAFPSESIRTRRDNPRFLNLIEALAFLHQYQRPLVVFATGERAPQLLAELADDELDDYRIEATLDDYAAAYTLAADLLYETLSELKRPLRAFFSAVKELGQEEATRRGLPASEAPLLVRQIRDRTKLEQHTVRRYLAELVELEYMGVAKGVRGAAASYRLVDLPEKQGGRIPGLLLPEELATRLERPGDEEKASWRSAAEA